MIMLPYLLSAGYYLKLTIKGESLEGKTSGESIRIWLIAILGTVYGGWLLYASGLTYILITALLYAPGSLIYYWSKKERGEKAFSGKAVDTTILVVILVMFVASAILIGNGTIQPF